MKATNTEPSRSTPGARRLLPAICILALASACGTSPEDDGEDVTHTTDSSSSVGNEAVASANPTADGDPSTAGTADGTASDLASGNTNAEAGDGADSTAGGATPNQGNASGATADSGDDSIPGNEATSGGSGAGATDPQLGDADASMGEQAPTFDGDEEGMTAEPENGDELTADVEVGSESDTSDADVESDDGDAMDEASEPFTGTCTESQPTGANASGSGPHDVIVETNSDPGINEGTIFRPADMGGDEKYPIFVWGQGACSRNGLANETAMVEIASHGYFVVADGTPNGDGSRPMDRSNLEAMGAPLIAYVDWAIAENEKPCSAYYEGLDSMMVAANGFSCGGLMAQATVTDERIVTWGVTSSGMAGATQDFYDLIHTPVLFVEGGPEEVAYDGGLDGYQNISQLDVPVLWFSVDRGHGGDLFQPDGGDFTKINLAWLNWWLKGDESETGKGLLVGAECPYCSDGAWEVMSANVP